METLIITLSTLLVGSIVLFSYIIRNLLLKVEKYEDVVRDQTSYLQNISKVVTESNKLIKELDTTGHYEADDELGGFFTALKNIQGELNTYMLPENYGKEES